MKYDIEPRDSEFVEEAYKRYKHILDNSPNDEAAKRAVRLCEKLLLYLVIDDPNFDDDFKLSYEELIELSVGLLEILKTAFACHKHTEQDLAQVYKERESWNPDWEICYHCDKRYTRKCNPENCNPMDI